uniref:CCF-like protein n=1 Tax=Allolobophora icterica TaxID=332519 RepID=Q3I700_9ANNE|nr:CCF-like protein [Aporrectodea icterica]
MRWTVVVLCLLIGEGCFAFDDWDQFEIVWQDEFDTLDDKKWQHEVTASGGGNSEFQLYTQDKANSFVRDGKLFIKPTLLVDNINPETDKPYGNDFMKSGVLDVKANYESCTNADNNGCSRTGAAGDIPPVMSARLRSYEKFSFTFGRVVISAKMPVGDWLWPAIWMLPEKWEYGDWPRSGEIDIIESIGNRDFKDTNGGFIGIQKMGSTLHWGPAPDENRFGLTHLSKNDDGRNYGDNFHTFYFDWSPNGLRFFVDDENQALLDVPYPLIDKNPDWVNFWEWGKPWKPETTNPWESGTNLAPFDKAFHFILNVAVGGLNGFIPDGATNGGEQKPWSNGDSYVSAMQKFYDARGNWKGTWDDEGDNNAMQVDYIRVYKRK